MIGRYRYPLTLLLILALSWELCAWIYPRWGLLFPPLSQSTLRLFSQPQGFAFHAWVTLKEMTAGLALAGACALPLAWLMARFNWARLSLQPLFVLIQCVPMFTLAPLMVLCFGWSFFAIVIPTALMVFFPLTLNIYQGIRATPKSYLEFFRSHNASTWQTLWKLRLPFALPHVFSGLRVSAAIAGVGAVAGEWAGAQAGLGVLLLEYRRNMDLVGVFAALLCLMIVTLGFYGAATALERWSRWRQHCVE